MTAEGELPPSSSHLPPVSEMCLEEQQAGSPGGKVLEQSCKFCWGRAFRDGICYQQQQSWQVQFHWEQTGSSTLGLIAQHTKNKGLVWPWMPHLSLGEKYGASSNPEGLQSSKMPSAPPVKLYHHCPQCPQPLCRCMGRLEILWLCLLTSTKYYVNWWGSINT